MLIQKHHGPILFSCFFIAEEVDGVGDKGSEDAKRLPLRCACFMDEAWFWQTKLLVIGPLSFVPDYQDF